RTPNTSNTPKYSLRTSKILKIPKTPLVGSTTPKSTPRTPKRQNPLRGSHDTENCSADPKNTSRVPQHQRCRKHPPRLPKHQKPTPRVPKHQRCREHPPRTPKDRKPLRKPQEHSEPRTPSGRTSSGLQKNPKRPNYKITLKSLTNSLIGKAWWKEFEKWKAKN